MADKNNVTEGVVSVPGGCPECGSTEHLEMRDYSMIWHEGRIWCTNRAEHKDGRDRFVRNFDAG